MKVNRRSWTLGPMLAFGFAVPLMVWPDEEPDPVSFNREIRPILASHCYACHGPDKQQEKAGLRLDLEDRAKQPLPSGVTAVVPGDLESSALISRITADDPEDVMPPPAHEKPLSPEQIQTLRRWVEEGAKWERHWAYIRPERPDPPQVKTQNWDRNDLDRFVLAQQEKRGLEPSPEAPRTKLIRRASLDLTGLPPTVAEIEAFLEDDSDQAYEKLVDRLLESKHYGERQAMFWLDLARYGETQGFHHDRHRDMWRWRDWVINAYNENKPFDEFTVEQLAGDLLPNPTREQLVATGFHRNEMTTSEGGALPEEYSVKYVVGRVDTTARVWLGTSLACAECHDHKYDPISQEEYYRFFAYFNNVPEDGLDRGVNPRPRLPLPSEAQSNQMASLAREITALETGHRNLVEAPNQDYDRRQNDWAKELGTAAFDDWEPLAGLAQPKNEAATYTFDFHTSQNKVTGIRLEVVPAENEQAELSAAENQASFLLTGFEALARPSARQDAGRPPAELKLVEWRAIGPFGANLDSAHLLETVFAPEGKLDFDSTYGESRLQWTAPLASSGQILEELTAAGGAVYLTAKIATEQAMTSVLKVNTSLAYALWLNHEKLPPPENGEFRIELTKGDNRLLVKLAVTESEPAVAFECHEYFPPFKPVKINKAIASRETSGHGVAETLNGKSDSGWSIETQNEPAAAPEYAWFQTEKPIANEPGTQIRVKLTFASPVSPATLQRFRLAVKRSSDLPAWTALPTDVRSEIIRFDRDELATFSATVQKHFRENQIEEVKQLRQLLDAKRKERADLDKSIPVAMVMDEREQRKDTFVLVRGEYNNPGKKVEPGLPSALFSDYEAEGNDRLALARWLVDPDHPLTARVIVNHYWQQFFGMGIVKTSEDFGTQGEWPSHPDLLDWLAREFVDSGWNVKRLHRLILTSATYRQDSLLRKDQPQVDPSNRYLARFPRTRLEAEGIRDIAMAASGLLDQTIGGESVYPWQPPGLWEQVAFQGTRKWEQSSGKLNYRRGLYVYWRRSVPYASFVIFDAPSRETCTVKRARTNTPLQALALMNDPVYVEAARALAARIMTEKPADLEQQIHHAWKLVLGRSPEAKEVEQLRRAYQEELAYYSENRKEANQLIHIGASEPPVALDICELAAWTVVGNILLNLDETITKG